MSKALAKKEETTVLTQWPEPSSVAHIHSTVLATDKLYPVVRCAQAQTEAVAEGIARPGDLILYPAVKKLGDPKTPIEFIPMRHTNEWVDFEIVNGKAEWRGQEPRTAANQDLPWDYEKNGKPYKRQAQVTIYGILPGQVKEFMDNLASDSPDPELSIKPVAISFKVYGLKCAKEILSILEDLPAKNKLRVQMGHKPIAPYSYSFLIHSEKTENKKGLFYRFKKGNITAVKDPNTLEIARAAYIALQAATELKTVDAEAPENLEQSEYSTRGDLC